MPFTAEQLDYAAIDPERPCFIRQWYWVNNASRWQQASPGRWLDRARVEETRARVAFVRSLGFKARGEWD